MKLFGLQKLTLLDFPGHTACTVFTGGCNFRCPFCHNAPLVTALSETPFMEENEFFSFLETRRGILDGVCITGGEPLMQKDLPDFIEKIKNMGFLVKLDTNGSFPERLAALVDRGLLDFVAMDIKNSLEKYSLTAGCEIDLSAIEKSIDLLLADKVDYEFRTTVVKELHTEEDIEKIATRICGAKHFYLQNFVDSGNLIGTGLSAHSEENMIRMRSRAQGLLENVSIRGI